MTELVASKEGFLFDGTDETATLNALLASLQAAGVGAHIIFDGMVRIDGQIFFPNNGFTGRSPSQVPIRLSAAVTDQQGQTRSFSYPSGGLDLRYAGRVDTGCSTTAGSSIVADASATASDLGKWVLNANVPDKATIMHVEVGVGYTLSHPAMETATAQSFTVVGGKIVTLGLGTLELDHIYLKAGGATDPAPFVWTTNTTLKVHDCRIEGNPNKSGDSADQDIAVLGGVGDGMVLTTALVSGTAYTSLAVSPSMGPIPSGSLIKVGVGTNTQTFTSTAAIVAGATSIPVTSLAANADYPVRTLVWTTNISVGHTVCSPFQGYGTHIHSNHFERTRRILGQAYVSDVYIENNVWWQTCGSDRAQTPSTLTTALVKGTAYTTLAITALNKKAYAGDVFQIGVASGAGAFYQTVTLAADAAAGAASLSVNSFTANAAYPTGRKVFNTSRNLAACVETESYLAPGAVSTVHVVSNRLQMNQSYNYATISGNTSNTAMITGNLLQDFNANQIACHRFVDNAGNNFVVPSLVGAGANLPAIDDAGAVPGGASNQMVLDPRSNGQSQIDNLTVKSQLVLVAGGASPIGPRMLDTSGNQWYMNAIGAGSERMIFYREAFGTSADAQLELTRRHIVGLGTPPTVASLISGSATLSGSDLAGTVTFDSGAGSAAGDIIQLSWNKVYLSTPRSIIWTPANAAAAGLGVPYASTLATNTARLGVLTGPAASTIYKWSYVVIG